MNDIPVLVFAMPINSEVIYDGIELDLAVTGALLLGDNTSTKVCHPSQDTLKYFAVTDRANRQSPRHLAGRVPRCLPVCTLGNGPDFVRDRRHSNRVHPNQVPVASH